MKRKQINRIIQMPITIHAEADVQKAVTQIHLAAGKASKGGKVEITIHDPANPEVPGTRTQVQDLSEVKDKLSKAKAAHVETINELTLARTRIQELEALGKAAPQAPGSPTVDPGSQNEPPAEVKDKPKGSEAPEKPELVQKAEEKIAKGKIPNAKERKALEDWEKANG